MINHSIPMYFVDAESESEDKEFVHLQSKKHPLDKDKVMNINVITEMSMNGHFSSSCALNFYYQGLHKNVTTRFSSDGADTPFKELLNLSIHRSAYESF